MGIPGDTYTMVSGVPIYSDKLSTLSPKDIKGNRIVEVKNTLYKEPHYPNTAKLQ